MLPQLVVRAVIGAFAALGTLRYGFGLYAWQVANKLEKPSYIVLEKLSNGVELRRYEKYLIAETTIDEMSLMKQKEEEEADEVNRGKKKRKGAQRDMYRETTGEGFRRCASYIFGKNVIKKSNENEKMTMTSPVRIEGGVSSTTAAQSEKTSVRSTASSTSTFTNEKVKVSFVIGSKYNMKNVPKPIDSKLVKIKEMKSHVMAVRSFSGPPPSPKRILKERAIIFNALLNIKKNLFPVDFLEEMKEKAESIVHGYHDPFITPNFLRKNEVAIMLDEKKMSGYLSQLEG